MENYNLGFDKYDESNWFEHKYKFTCQETNKQFYASQYDYHTLNKKNISDYNYDVSEAYPNLTKKPINSKRYWFF
jgi:hypothetical protein